MSHREENSVIAGDTAGDWEKYDGWESDPFEAEEIDAEIEKDEPDAKC